MRAWYNVYSKKCYILRFMMVAMYLFTLDSKFTFYQTQIESQKSFFVKKNDNIERKTFSDVGFDSSTVMWNYNIFVYYTTYRSTFTLFLTWFCTLISNCVAQLWKNWIKHIIISFGMGHVIKHIFTDTMFSIRSLYSRLYQRITTV